MNLIEVGLELFFGQVLNLALRGIYHILERRWERRYGPRECLEFKRFADLVDMLKDRDIEGYPDIKVNKACLSNFAPLYLCHSEDFTNLQTYLAEEVEKSKQIYDELSEKYGIPQNSSLFLRAIRQKTIRLDNLFRDFVETKKLRFLGMSLARFAPLTKDVRYSALFESGRHLQHQVSPSKASFEPFVPVFYDVETPRGVEVFPYVDVELQGKLLPLPEDWKNLLQSRGVQVRGNPYCIYVPNKDPYFIDAIALETSMSMDAWVAFYLPSLHLELPWYIEFEPTSDQSRRRVVSFFAHIHQSLVKYQKTQVLFYNDYVQPYLRDITPTFDTAQIRRLIQTRI